MYCLIGTYLSIDRFFLIRDRISFPPWVLKNQLINTKLQRIHIRELIKVPKLIKGMIIIPVGRNK